MCAYSSRCLDRVAVTCAGGCGHRWVGSRVELGAEEYGEKHYQLLVDRENQCGSRCHAEGGLSAERGHCDQRLLNTHELWVRAADHHCPCRRDPEPWEGL